MPRSFAVPVFLLLTLADPARPLSRTESEAKVRTELAGKMGVAEETVRVVESEDRTWPDERLGCGPRRGFGDPLPVAGYRIVLGIGERRYVYHTDRSGRFVRCEPPPKPIGPIS
jgi:hypothetical protein